MRTLPVVLLLATLTACGGGSSSDIGTVDQATTPTVPKCSTIWIVGKKLPDPYEGCVNDNNSTEISTSLGCTHGADLVTFEPKGVDHGYFTLTDGTIVDGGTDYANDKRYGPRYADCG